MPDDGAAERFYGKTALPAVHDTRNDGALLGPGFHGQLDHLHRRLGGVGRGRGDVHARLRLHIGRHAAVGPSGGLRVGPRHAGPLVHRRAAPRRVTIQGDVHVALAVALFAYLVLWVGRAKGAPRRSEY